MNLTPIVKSSAGLDVHLKIIVVTLLKEQPDGTIQDTVKEFSTFPEELTKLAGWLKSENVELSVMESTGVYWRSVFEALEAAGVKAYVVNAKHVKQVPGKKTDVSDSKWLATLARYGLVKASFIPEKYLRELRLVTRYRAKLKSTIASEINRMHKILNDSGMRLGLVFSDIQCASAQDIIDGLINGESVDVLVTKLRGISKRKEKELRLVLAQSLSETHKFLLKSIREHIVSLYESCKELDNKIFTSMKPYNKQWEILQTIPGIDALAAATIIAETGVDMQQFGSSEQFCSWAGICPGNNESAGKRKSAKTVKGSPSLRRILCEVANAATKTTSQFKSYYKAMQIRRGHKRSIIASGHKILRVIFTLLTNMKGYFDPNVDYEALLVKKNAPRWIQCLTKYGYLARTN